MITPVNTKSKFNKYNDMAVAPRDGDRDSPQASSKEVKSEANAELYGFFQSLIPENSKEKEAHNALNTRSKSMVTNFMDIPEQQRLPN